MLKSLVLGSCFSALALGLLPTPAKAQIDCSVYGDVGPRAVGACIDYNLRLKRERQRGVVRDINSGRVPVATDCSVYGDIGPRAVGACINQRLERRREVQRSVVREFNSIPSPGNHQYSQPSSRCDLVIEGQCYRRRY